MLINQAVSLSLLKDRLPSLFFLGKVCFNVFLGLSTWQSGIQKVTYLHDNINLVINELARRSKEMFATLVKNKKICFRWLAGSRIKTEKEHSRNLS